MGLVSEKKVYEEKKSIERRRKKMLQNNQKFIKKCFVGIAALLTAEALSACAGEQEKIKVEPVKVEIVNDEEDGKETENGAEGTTQIAAPPEHAGNDTEKTPADGEAADKEETSAAAEELKKQFGENCIVEQTFEFELGQNGEKLYFVPYMPQSGQDFYMEIVKDGAVLSEMKGYVPEALQGKKFVSLDAVSFFDVNFDGITDILLIETYGDTTFAAVYYGDVSFAELGDVYFKAQSRLSERLTESLDVVAISQIRAFLSGGKKNGEFSGYQEAYEAVVRLRELENPGPTDYSKGTQYDLIDFDGDDIPELVAGNNGYHMSLYTYSDGSVYALMNDWAYGAMGNAGYEYSPGKNSLRNYNADYAGLVNYLTYMTIGQQHSLEQVVQIVIYNFDDVNENGIPDEEEQDSYGNYGTLKIDGKEVTEEECDVYDAGEYEYIEGKMSADELLAELQFLL